MKKSIFAFIGTLVLSSPTFAATSIQESYPNEFLTAISPNGEWVAGSTGMGDIVIRNLLTGKEHYYNSDGNLVNYNVGNSAPISNTGVVIGTTNANTPSYWKDGKWYDLNTPNAQYTSYVFSITPDASLICGTVGTAPMSLDADRIMAVPAVWYLQDDGSYSDPEILPHPELDFTGRLPQYISAVSVSDDGNTIVGQVTDNYGHVQEPIVYTRDASGKWSYKMIYTDLINPRHFVFPEYPGDDPYLRPTQEEFMTEGELYDYVEAVEAWDASSGEPFPQYEDFMTAAEIKAYNDAMEEYEALHGPWQEKFDTFMLMYMQCLDEAYLFVFNNVKLSPDGKYYATTRTQTVFDDPITPKNTAYPVVLDIDGNRVIDLKSGVDLYTSYMASDYSVLATFHDPDFILSGRAYIFPQMKDAAIPIENWEATIDVKTASWLEDQTIRNVVVGVNPSGTFQFDDYVCSGVPYATPDLSVVILGTADDFGTWTDDEEFSSYVFTTGYDAAGVTAVTADGASMNLMPGGVILLEGAFDSIAVYDLAGSKVFEALNPGTSVSTGLDSGIYVLRGVTASGENATAKFKL